MNENLAWEVWDGDAFYDFVYTRSEAYGLAEAGYRIVLAYWCRA